MMHYFLQKSKNVDEITITFLLMGHTYIPVVSMHALIAKSINGKSIIAPTEWQMLDQTKTV